MNKQTGFTLIELVMVIVIIGILAAMAVPRFVDLETSAVDAAKDGTVGAVRSAFAITIAKVKGYPTLTQLADNVQTSNGTAAAASADGKGVAITINNDPYKVLTFTDATCGTATGAGGDKVQCVGDIVAGP